MLTIDRIIELKDFIRWNVVFRAAGLNENTMRSAMHNRRELRPEESEALLRALNKEGIYIHPAQKEMEFSSESSTTSRK